jgi:hypothetical protein
MWALVFQEYGLWDNIINGIQGRSGHELDKESKGKVVVYGETYHSEWECPVLLLG